MFLCVGLSCRQHRGAGYNVASNEFQENINSLFTQECPCVCLTTVITQTICARAPRLCHERGDQPATLLMNQFDSIDHTYIASKFI